MKVSIIGAGNVGATAAMKIASEGFAKELVLLDVKEGVAEGKAMDIMQSLMMGDSYTFVTGTTGDYSKTANSDVIVITSGVPRKPGMTREELVGVNSKVMTMVLDGATKYSPDAIFVVVSNPMDTMTQMVVNYLGVENANRVIGMGGALDSARFKYNIFMKVREKTPYIAPRNIQDCWVIGGHGDTTMIPIWEDARYLSYPLKELFSQEKINEIVENTMKGGATLTKLLGTSAWEAPAAGIAITVKAILNNEHKVIPSSSWSSVYNCFVGQICTISEDGIEDINWRCENIKRVQDKLIESVNAIKKVNQNI